jgi:DNA polymerase-3 subunit beta
MKFTCNRKALSEAFQLVCGVIEPKATKPVLKAVKVEAKEGTAKLAATDLTVGAVVTVGQVVVEDPGVILVYGEDANNILRESRDETIEWSLDGTICRIHGADSDFRMPTENPEEFPSVPEFTGTPTVEVARGDLDAMIKRTSFAISMEQMRYALNGILFVPGKGSLEVVATDGRRLAYTKRAAKSDKAQKGFIVPIKAVNEIHKMLVDGLETIALRFDESRIYARAAGASMFAQLVEGQFPSYTDVIPKGNDIKVPFSTDELASAVTRAALMTTPQSLAFRMRFEADTVRFNSSSAEHGEAKIELKVKYDAALVELCFNPVFILDMLRAIPGQEVMLEMKDGESPVLFRCGDDYLYVVMPISLRQE